MITLEGLEEVNGKIKGTTVGNKKYALVAERVQAFRELCPDGLITTEILYMQDGAVTMKASIYDEGGKLLATGLAQEKDGSSFINKTSYIENCETSAVGRALAMLGIGSECSMASAEEVANAQIQQKQAEERQQRTEAEFDPNELCTDDELKIIQGIWAKKTDLPITSQNQFKEWPKVTKAAYVWFMRKMHENESEDNTVNTGVSQ